MPPILADRPIANAAFEFARARAREYIRKRRAENAGDPLTFSPLTEEEEKEADAIAANESNLERKPESRTVMGNVQALVSALGAFLTGLAAELATIPAFDAGFAAWMPWIIMAFGAHGTASNLYALFGRLKANLPPISFSILNPWSWFGARSKAEVLEAPVAPEQLP